jgi:hypothetical protein
MFKVSVNILPLVYAIFIFIYIKLPITIRLCVKTMSITQIYDKCRHESLQYAYMQATVKQGHDPISFVLIHHYSIYVSIYATICIDHTHATMLLPGKKYTTIKIDFV